MKNSGHSQTFYQNVTYYRFIFEERGMTGRAVQIVDDLTKLLILTMDIIRHIFNDMTVSGIKNRKPLLQASSGSTGTGSFTKIFLVN